MGIKLVEEVMDWCPDDVTPAQRWCLTVLARDANDATRETWHGPEHPEILRRVRMTPKKWEAMRSILLKRGLIEPVSGGFRGQAVRYRIATLFAPCVVQDWRKTPQQRGAFAGYAVKVERKDPPGAGVNQQERPPENGGQSTERPPYRGGPTPPTSFSSPPTSSTATGSPESLPPVKAEEEGSTATTPEQQRAALFLMRLPAPWTLGPADAAKVAPVLAAAVSRLGLDYDDHLASQIACNDFGVQNHAAVIETKRIPNLRPAAAKPAALPPACPACLAETPAAARNKQWRRRNGRPCPDCHPDAAPAAA